MRVFINFAKGFRSTANTTRMVFLLFLINLVFSMILAVPLYRSLQDSFGNSLVGERMARGFDYLWWEEFKDQSRGLETTFKPSIIGRGAVLDNLEALIQLRYLDLPSLVLILGILYIILHTFLAGGVLRILDQKNPQFSLKRFFGGAGFYFPRFLLLTLISLIPFYIVGVFLGTRFDLILDMISRNSVSEVKPFYYNLAFSVILFLLFLLIHMVFDYARIKIVLEEKRNVWNSAWEAFVFVLKHPFSTVSLYALIFLLQAGITVGYVFLKEAIPQANFQEVLSAFFLQQVFIFSIIWLRCWLYSSQMELYRYLK